MLYPPSKQHRYINLQEEYIKDEQRYVATMARESKSKLRCIRSLKRELVRAQEEIKRIQSVPLVIGQFMEAIDQRFVSSTAHHLQRLTWKQHWNSAVINWFQLCCPHPLNP